MADESLNLTEGNGKFTNKEAFVLGMKNRKDFDRRVRSAGRKHEMRKIEKKKKENMK